MLEFTEDEIDELRRYGAIGAGCGPGWHALLTPVLDLVRAHNRTCRERTDHIALAQIKEKFGSLRIYLSCEHTMPRSISLAVRIAGSVAAHVCERCGRVGVRVRRPELWVPVACPTCAAHPTPTYAEVEALAASAPPLFDPAAPHWWQERSPDHLLIFAAQHHGAAVREQAYAHLNAWREGHPTTWETVVASYAAGVPVPPYPEPLHTMATILATGRHPNGRTPTPEQLSLLLQHPDGAVRVATQMSIAPRAIDAKRSR